jgi:hypothetical protein
MILKEYDDYAQSIVSTLGVIERGANFVVGREEKEKVRAANVYTYIYTMYGICQSPKKGNELLCLPRQDKPFSGRTCIAATLRNLPQTKFVPYAATRVRRIPLRKVWFGLVLKWARQGLASRRKNAVRLHTKVTAPARAGPNDRLSRLLAEY